MSTYTLVQLFKAAKQVKIKNRRLFNGREYTYAYALDPEQASYFRHQLETGNRYDFRAVKKKHGPSYLFIFYTREKA